MMEYTPDCWVIVEISGSKVEKTYRRVLAGWFGGFLGANSWKLSSGFEDMIDRGDHWEIHNHSGSIYYCRKSAERFNSMTGAVFNSYSSENSDEISFKRITIGEE